MGTEQVVKMTTLQLMYTSTLADLLVYRSTGQQRKDCQL